MGSPCWRISYLQAYSDGVGGAAVRSFWLLYFGSRSGVGGRLSIFPLFCEAVAYWSVSPMVVAACSSGRRLLGS
jgi:hypothetical protein